MNSASLPQTGSGFRLFPIETIFSITTYAHSEMMETRHASSRLTFFDDFPARLKQAPVFG
jgi:hypothetical protein